MSITVVKIESSYKNTITSLLKELVGFNNKVIEKDNYTIIEHNYENIDDIKSLILSFSSEQMINVFCYQTITYNYNEEYNLVKNALNNYKNGFYTLKDLLINDDLNNHKKEILSLILSGSGITEDFIIEYLKYDLNLSKAAKEMFIHRNTMIYKLDKLKELTGFDLRCFKDSYILYNLIINK